MPNVLFNMDLRRQLLSTGSKLHHMKAKLSSNSSAAMPHGGKHSFPVSVMRPRIVPIW